MCACHATLGPRPTRAGPATAALRHEHQLILRALAVLERAAAGLEGGPGDEALLQETVELLRTLADRCHHGKEEAELFPRLQAQGLGHVLDAFLPEHEEGRAYLRTLGGPGPAPERARAARRYVGLLRDHIEREDEVLFPMVDQILTLDDQEALVRRYEAVEREVMGPGAHDRLLATLDRLEAALGGPAERPGEGPAPARAW
jgi:hemerythrin-like domain-containing protein